MMLSRTRFVVVTILAYAIGASVWILVSDSIMGLLLDPETMTRFAKVEGLAFVAVTAILLGMAMLRIPMDRMNADGAPQISPPPSAAGGMAKGMRLQNFLVRLILLSAAPSLVLAVVLGGLTILDRQAEDDAHADHIVRDVMAEVDQDLSSRLGALGMLANSPLLDEPALWPHFYRLAQEFKAGFGSHVIVADTGEPMQMVMNTREPLGTPLPPLPRPQGRAAAPEALATGQPVVGDVVMGPVAKSPLIAIAVPAARKGAATRYIVLITIETAQFQEHLDRLRLPAGWSLTVQDSHGSTIASRGRGADGVAAGRDGLLMQSSSVAGWTVVLTIPRDVRNAPVIAASILLGLGLLLVGGGSVLGGLWASRTLDRQISSLADGEENAATPTIAEIARVRQRLDLAARLVRNNQERFARLFETVPVALGFASSDGRILARNRHFDSVFGYPATELATIDDWWRLAYPDPEYREQMKASWIERTGRASVEQGRIAPAEAWITCGDGRRHLFEVTGIALDDGALAMFVDVTEQRQAEEALRHRAKEMERLLHQVSDSEEKFRLLAENAVDVIFWADPKQRLRYLSPACLPVFGRAAADFLADPDLMTAIIHPDDREAYVRHLAEVDSHVEEMEFRVVHPDGSIHWVAHRCWPVHAADGVHLGRHGINRDVTDRKQADAALREGEERFRQLFEHAPIALSTSDRDGRIALMNSSFIGLFGYAPAEMPTVEDWRRLVLVDPQQREFESLDRANNWKNQSGHSPNMEFHEQAVRCRDGSTKTVLLSRRNLGTDMLLVVVDVTERKAIEANLVARNEDLRRFNSAMVGREIDILAMKKTINALSAELGRDQPYPLSFLQDEHGKPTP